MCHLAAGLCFPAGFFCLWPVFSGFLQPWGFGNFSRTGVGVSAYSVSAEALALAARRSPPSTGPPRLSMAVEAQGRAAAGRAALTAAAGRPWLHGGQKVPVSEGVGGWLSQGAACPAATPGVSTVRPRPLGPPPRPAEEPRFCLVLGCDRAVPVWLCRVPSNAEGRVSGSTGYRCSSSSGY